MGRTCKCWSFSFHFLSLVTALATDQFSLGIISKPYVCQGFSACVHTFTCSHTSVPREQGLSSLPTSVPCPNQFRCSATEFLHRCDGTNAPAWEKGTGPAVRQRALHTHTCNIKCTHTCSIKCTHTNRSTYNILYFLARSMYDSVHSSFHPLSQVTWPIPYFCQLFQTM